MSTPPAVRDRDRRSDRRRRHHLREGHARHDRRLFGGIGGGMYASYFYFIKPDLFGFKSIDIP